MHYARDARGSSLAEAKPGSEMIYATGAGSSGWGVITSVRRIDLAQKSNRKRKPSRTLNSIDRFERASASTEDFAHALIADFRCYPVPSSSAYFLVVERTCSRSPRSRSMAGAGKLAGAAVRPNAVTEADRSSPRAAASKRRPMR